MSVIITGRNLTATLFRRLTASTHTHTHTHREREREKVENGIRNNIHFITCNDNAGVEQWVPTFLNP